MRLEDAPNEIHYHHLSSIRGIPSIAAVHSCLRHQELSRWPVRPTAFVGFLKLPFRALLPAHVEAAGQPRKNHAPTSPSAPNPARPQAPSYDSPPNRHARRSHHHSPERPTRPFPSPSLHTRASLQRERVSFPRAVIELQKDTGVAAHRSNA